MSGQYQPPPQYGAPPPQYMPQEKQGIQDMFIAKDKLGLFLLLGIGILLIGALLINICLSGLLDGDIRVIILLGYLALDMGFIVIITLLMLTGIFREDFNERTRAAIVRAAGFAFGLYIVSWTMRMAMVMGAATAF